MSVYVDEALFESRGRRWCHLWADSLDELHAFAARLGLKRAWFQCPPAASWEHYDLTDTKRAQAIRYGAKPTDRYGPSEFVARRKGNTKLLDSIAAVRAQRDAIPKPGMLL